MNWTQHYQEWEKEDQKIITNWTERPDKYNISATDGQTLMIKNGWNLIREWKKEIANPIPDIRLTGIGV